MERKTPRKSFRGSSKQKCEAFNNSRRNMTKERRNPEKSFLVTSRSNFFQFVSFTCMFVLQTAKLKSLCCKPCFCLFAFNSFDVIFIGITALTMLRSSSSSSSYECGRKKKSLSLKVSPPMEAYESSLKAYE